MKAESRYRRLYLEEFHFYLCQLTLLSLGSRDLMPCTHVSDAGAGWRRRWGAGGKPCGDRGMVERYGARHDDVGGGDGGVRREDAGRTVRQEL